MFSPPFGVYILFYVIVSLIYLFRSLCRGFNEALNGFSDEGWSLISNDGVDDITILVNSNPEKLMGLNGSFTSGYNSICSSILCAKASMLLQVRELNLYQSLYPMEYC